MSNTLSSHSFSLPQPNPANHLTPFDFYCDSFEDLPNKMEQAVGYKVTPNNIWSICITPFEISRLHITLTIIYWKDDSKKI